MEQGRVEQDAAILPVGNAVRLGSLVLQVSLDLGSVVVVVLKTPVPGSRHVRSEEHTSELQSHSDLHSFLHDALPICRKRGATWLPGPSGKPRSWLGCCCSPENSSSWEQARRRRSSPRSHRRRKTRRE